MTTRHAIEIAGLTKSYGDNAVLRGVGLSVPAGTIFALLGSNGAGKTTAVRMLSTLLKADGGTAAVDEILSGRENLVRVAQPRRLKDPGRIADGLLARFDVTDATGRRTAAYASGMRRRLDIAMSLIGDQWPASPAIGTRSANRAWTGS